MASGALRPLVRIEWRQLRRNPWRTLLVVLLIAVPVAAMVGGSSVLLGTRQTLEEQRAAVMGRAALIVRDTGRIGVAAALAMLPDAARRRTVFHSSL